MGFLDGLLGLKTNASLSKATGVQNGYLQRVGDNNDLTLRNYSDLAGHDIQQGTTAASNVLNSTTGQAQDTLRDYGGQAQGALTAGNMAAQGQLQQSSALFQPYSATGLQANGAYADALGLNGPDGNARATSSFQAAPGYQYQVDQGSDALARHAASLGMADSGNTAAAIATLGGHLADQGYQSYLDRLSGLQNTGLQADSAISGNNALGAQFNYGTGTQGASLLDKLGSGLAGESTSLGTQQAGLFGTQGVNLANLSSGLGNSLVNNSTGIAKAVSGNALNSASAADAVTNANNGIFSNALGMLGSGLGSTATGKGFLSKLAAL